MPASKKLHDFIDAVADPYAGCAKDDRKIIFITTDVCADQHSDVSYGLSILDAQDVEAMGRLIALAGDLRKDESVPQNEKDVATGIRCPVSGLDFVISHVDGRLEELLGEDFSGSGADAVVVDNATAEIVQNEIGDEGMEIRTGGLDAALWSDNVEFSGFEHYGETAVSFRINADDVAMMRELLDEKPVPTPK